MGGDGGNSNNSDNSDNSNNNGGDSSQVDLGTDASTCVEEVGFKLELEPNTNTNTNGCGGIDNSSIDSDSDSINIDCNNHQPDPNVDSTTPVPLPLPTSEMSVELLNSIDNDDSGYRVGLTTLVFALVRRANNSYMSNVRGIFKYLMLSNTFVSVLPWIGMPNLSNTSSNTDTNTNNYDGYTILYLILVPILNFAMYGVILQFFSGVILDIFRRRSFARKLSSMIEEPNRYDCNLYR